MLNENDSRELLSTNIHYLHLEHESKMNVLIEMEEFNLFRLLKPKIYRDGNQWCVLYGENLKKGIFGYGESPYNAICNWERKWYKKIEEKK